VQAEAAVAAALNLVILIVHNMADGITVNIAVLSPVQLAVA
jgi:hypothetical protein